MATNIPMPTYTASPTPITGYRAWPTLIGVVEYRVWRGWWDFEFVRYAGRVVTACCPAAQNANYGELQVWQYDGEYPPNATTSVTLETEGVFSCSLLARGSGILDLWYLKAGVPFQPHHRFSRDGGLTWSAAEVHTGGVLNFDTGTDIPPLNNGIRIGYRYLPACIQRGTGLTCFAMDAPYPGPNFGAYWLVAELAADGERWEFTGKRLLAGTGEGGAVPTGDAATNRIGSVSQLQAMSDGSVMTLPGLMRVSKIEESGAMVLTAPTASGVGDGFQRKSTWRYIGHQAVSCIREVDGACLWIGSWNHISPGFGLPRPGLDDHGFAGWQQFRMTTPPDWDGTTFNPPGVTLVGGGTQINYDLSFRVGLTGSGVTGAGDLAAGEYAYSGAFDQIKMVKARRDGTFECLRANALGELEFAWARSLPWTNACTWEGA